MDGATVVQSDDPGQGPEQKEVWPCAGTNLPVALPAHLTPPPPAELLVTQHLVRMRHRRRDEEVPATAAPGSLTAGGAALSLPDLTALAGAAQEVAPWPHPSSSPGRTGLTLPRRRDTPERPGAPAPAPDPPHSGLRGRLRLHRVAGRHSRPAGHQPDRPGDRPARRHRRPLVRRADLPAGQRAGHPGGAPVGLRPRLGHRSDRARRGAVALGQARPPRRGPPPRRGAPGQGRPRPPAGRRRRRPGHPGRRSLPGRGAGPHSAGRCRCVDVHPAAPVGAAPLAPPPHP